MVEPNETVYIIQSPHNIEQFTAKKETLKQNIEPYPQNDHVFKKLYYIYEKELYQALMELETKQILITPTDFESHAQWLQQVFAEKPANTYRLTAKQTKIIQRALNPNTNLTDYISKTLPANYEEKVKSKTQAKQKFKGSKGAGKTNLLVKRVINCANRLKDNGKILVVVGDLTKANNLKDLITAEDGRSLQELGIDVDSYQQLVPSNYKYKALFVDDAEDFETQELQNLLDNYLVEMTEDNDYEYVVMADEIDLPKIPRIPGPYNSLNNETQHISELLNDSRKIFLDILNG